MIGIHGMAALSANISKAEDRPLGQHTGLTPASEALPRGSPSTSNAQ